MARGLLAMIQGVRVPIPLGAEVFIKVGLLAEYVTAHDGELETMGGRLVLAGALEVGDPRRCPDGLATSVYHFYC